MTTFVKGLFAGVALGLALGAGAAVVVYQGRDCPVFVTPAGERIPPAATVPAEPRKTPNSSESYKR